MASGDAWHVRFTGKGGHGAMPQDAIDPTPALSRFIGALQTIASREVSPTETVVVSVGKMWSGDAFNIIPDVAEAGGNIRSFSREIRESMEGRIRRIAEGIASAYQCGAELEMFYYYPGVVNDPHMTEVFRKIAERYAGRENVAESPLLMVSEDFSYYQETIPGTFFFIGCGCAEKGTDRPHHSPAFDIDDDVLPLGVGPMSAFAIEALEDLGKKNGAR